MFISRRERVRILLFGASIIAANLFGVTSAVEIETAHCEFNSGQVVTVSGVIRKLRTVTRPFVWPDGSQDYSIVDSVDEYELSSPDWPCGREPLLVRFRYGHVNPVSCANDVPATVSGFYRRDTEGERPNLIVMVAGDIKCDEPPAR